MIGHLSVHGRLLFMMSVSLLWRKYTLTYVFRAVLSGKSQPWKMKILLKTDLVSNRMSRHQEPRVSTDKVWSFLLFTYPGNYLSKSFHPDKGDWVLVNYLGDTWVSGEEAVNWSPWCDQSEACIKITWPILTNQRLTSELVMMSISTDDLC